MFFHFSKERPFWYGKPKLWKRHAQPRRLDTFTLSRPPGHSGGHSLLAVRLAGQERQRALPGRLQPALSGLPQRVPGVHPRAPSALGCQGRAGHPGGPHGLAGGCGHLRRRTHPGPGPARPGRRAVQPGPGCAGGHQRHPARGCGRAAGAFSANPLRRGRQGPLREIPRAHRRGPVGRRGRGRSHGPVRPGGGSSRRVRFPHHPGSGAHPRRRGLRRGILAHRRGPSPAAFHTPQGEFPCPS